MVSSARDVCEDDVGGSRDTYSQASATVLGHGDYDSGPRRAEGMTINVTRDVDVTNERAY